VKIQQTIAVPAVNVTKSA